MRTAVVLLATLLPPVVAPRAQASRAAAHTVAAHAPVPGVGMYRAVSLDRQPLPAVELLPATTGYHHYVKLDQAVVTLRPNGQFIASFHYWHHHLKNGAPVPSTPMLNETYRGTWVMNGIAITLQPQASKGKRAPQAILGTLAGNRLRVSYPFTDKGKVRTVNVELARDANW